jgi:hypothetical protein
MPFPRALHPTTVGLSLAGIRVPGLKMPLFGGDGSWNNGGCAHSRRAACVGVQRPARLNVLCTIEAQRSSGIPCSVCPTE